MIVSSLRLFNFRNYSEQQLELPAGLVALTGDNGQGKTNLLEALCVLATTKSPLVERDRELIRWEQNEARIVAEIQLSVERGEPRRLDYSWRVAGQSIAREMRAGGVPQSAIGQWLGQLQVVAFFPHDLVLITGEPGERRRFLNLELGKTNPDYFAATSRYRRALQQRNALLRQLAESRSFRRQNANAESLAANLSTLGEWNGQVIAYGSRILAQRARFFRELQPLLREVHRKLSGLEGPFSLEYVPGIKLPVALRSGDAALACAADDIENEADSWRELLLSSLDADHETDHRRGTTASGPHRDDILFKLGDMDLRRYGSQGQQRLAVLALKVALAHWVKQSTGEPPILLLDDALSELDETRRDLLLAEATCFPQSVITATDDRFVQATAATVFTVQNGQIASNPL